MSTPIMKALHDMLAARKDAVAKYGAAVAEHAQRGTPETMALAEMAGQSVAVWDEAVSILNHRIFMETA